VFFLRGLADAGVEAVGRVLGAVEVGERFFCRIEVADVVLCRVFRAFAVEIRQQRVFDCRRVAAGQVVGQGGGGGGRVEWGEGVFCIMASQYRFSVQV